MPIWPVLTKIMSITRTPSGMVCTEGGSLGFDFSSCLRLSPLPLQMHWPLYASFSIAASGVRYSLQHSSYMREYSLLGLWCIRLLRVWES